MVKLKPSRPSEGNELMIPTDGNKGQVSKPKKYRGKKQPRNKSSLEPETETEFQGRCTDLEGYTFDLVPRASDKFARTMKELEQYLGKNYNDSCQPAIMTETADNFPDPEMPNITELGTECPKTDGEMTYLEKNNIDEAIRQKLRKKDVYESDILFEVGHLPICFWALGAQLSDVRHLWVREVDGSFSHDGWLAAVTVGFPKVRCSGGTTSFDIPVKLTVASILLVCYCVSSGT